MTGVIWDLFLIALALASGVWRASRGDAWWALVLGFCTGAVASVVMLRAMCKARERDE